jgi:hypothetical protein
LEPQIPFGALAHPAFDSNVLKPALTEQPDNFEKDDITMVNSLPYLGNFTLKIKLLRSVG